MGKNPMILVFALGGFVLLIALLVYLPNMNFVNWGLDFTTMDKSTLNLFEYAILIFAIGVLFYGAFSYR